jgi:hypothetical protein
MSPPQVCGMLHSRAGDLRKTGLPLLANGRKPTDQPPFWWVKNVAVLNNPPPQIAALFGGRRLPFATFGSPSQVSKSAKLS